MSSIFISYSRKDIRFAERIVQALARNKLDTWIDWKSIPKGEDWEQEIYRGIEEAEAFVFLISPDSVQSEMCSKEIAHAARNNKRVIPIVIRDAVVKNFVDEISKKEISRRNWIFCRAEQDNFNQAIDQTLETIRTDYDWLRYHTSLQVKALEWERNHLENSFLLRGKELLHAEQQLTANISKEPYPTELQHTYTRKSRQVTDKQRKTIRSIVAGVTLVMLMLAIYGFFQQSLARERAKIAVARRLVAEAQSMYRMEPWQQMTTLLLAIQSMRLSPSPEAAELLQYNMLAHPIASMDHGKGVAAVAFSPDGKYVVSGGEDGTARVWEADTGKEIARMTHDDDRFEVVFSVAFSADGKYVVSGSIYYDIIVWEAATGREIRRIINHGEMTSVALSPDGNYVASGNTDDTARVWEVTTGKEVARMTYGGDVLAVAFSPDGQYVVSSGCEKYDISNICTEGTARVWEASTGKEITRMIYDGHVTSLAFSPDGQYVLLGFRDGMASLWDASTGKETVGIAHDAAVTSAVFSPDGKYVVSGSWDNTARVWEAATGKEVSRITHEDVVTSVAFSPDGRYVVSGSRDYTARVWEAITGKEIVRMIHGLQVGSVAFSPDSRYVVSGSWEARVWEVAPGKQIIGISHDDVITSVAFSPDSKYVVSGSWDNTARVWEAATGKEIARLTHDSNILSTAFSPDSKYVVSGSADETVRVWEAATGKEIARMIHDDVVTSAVFSPNGKYVVSGSTDDSVRFWEVATGKEIARMAHDGDVTSAVFSPDGKYVVSGSWDGTARVWEAATGKEVTRITHAFDHNIVTSVAFSPNGKYVVSADTQWGSYVSEAATGKEITRIYDLDVTSVALSPDGKYGVSGSVSGGVNVWEVATGKDIAYMTHDDDVSAVAFSPDGKYVVSGSCGVLNRISGCTPGSARVWEAATGHEIARVTYNDGVTSVAFSPDGKYVVSGSKDGTAHVWIYRPEDLIADACSRVTKNLTLPEWEEYTGHELPYQAACPELSSPGLILIENVYYYYILTSVWATMFYLISGWLVYRRSFLHLDSSPPAKNSALTWKRFAVAATHGGLLLLVITSGIVMINDVSAGFSPLAVYLPLLLIPAGLWAGAAYSHFTRFESGQLTRMKRILLGGVAGFFSASITSILFALVFDVFLNEDIVFDTDWFLTALEDSGVAGRIGGLLSALGALIYINGFQGRIMKSKARSE